MARVKNYKKNIACLESLWDEDMEDRLSVAPILELASKLDKVKFTYLTCNTMEEFKYNLTLLKRRKGYGILYLAFHGGPGEIILADSSINIETLSGLMGNGFVNWIIHFGGCGTINIEKNRIRNFMAVTGVSLVVGYKEDLEWADGAALDLLLLYWLQSYRDMRKFWEWFQKTYKGLISLTGMKAFHK